MTQTTRLLRQSSVVIVDCPIPEDMTIAEYRRSRAESAAEPGRRTWRRVRGSRRGRV